MSPHASKILLGAVVALLPASASAFLTATFPSGTYGPAGTQIAGKDGWTLTGDNLYNPLDDNGSTYSNYLDGSLSATIGGYYVTPASPGDLDATVSLNHTAVVGLQYLHFYADFAIQSSNEDSPGRDGFGFSFKDASNNNLFTISLVPVASALNDAFQVRYTLGGDPQQNAKYGTEDMFIYHNGNYFVDLKFTENGDNPTFSATIIGSNTKTFTGTATGMGSAQVETFGAEWNVIDGGSNGLIFDDLNVIPEPSSSLLLCLAGLGLISRRRRA